MATAETHNKLIQINFGNKKHFNHFLSGQDINYLKDLESRIPLSKLPVCGACEKLAFSTKGGYCKCPTCGAYTKDPVTLATYWSKGLDVDATGETSKKVVEKSRELAKETFI